MPEWIMSLLEDTLEFLRSHALQAAGVLFALLAGWTIAGWVRRSMLLAFERSKFDLTLGRFFANLSRYALIVATAIGCLGAVGFETTSFAAVIGAAGLAIGLRAAKLHLDEAGLGIPFPQMDVHFDSKGLRTVSGERAA